MSLEWSHSEEEVLIDFYTKHESLHNKHHADYNYNRKNKLLVELVKELNRQSAGKKFKIENVSTHWNELRNTYNQHKRKVTKEELSGTRNVKKPDWIWWPKMTYIFTGATVSDNGNRSQMNFVSTIEHHQTDYNGSLSPAKKQTRSTLLPQTTPKLTATKVKRHTTMTPLLAQDLSPSPAKIRQRRSIHSLPQNVEVDGSSLNSPIHTESEFEFEISVTPVAGKGRQKRTSASSNANRQLSTTMTVKPTRMNSNSASPPSIASMEGDQIKHKGRQRRTVNTQATVTPMEIDSSTSANDECSSTAMFVESRLRNYDESKRQRIIFKIHELFYQEDA